MYHHGLHLARDLGTPRLSWRRLGVLLRHLPAGSAVHRAIDPEGAGWNVDTYLLAHVADLLAAANWQRGNTGAKTPSQKPRPIPRPGTVSPRKSHDERVAEWKARHCNREEVST